ncbi:uncharacterized protein LOC108607238 [Drosophila busckii]|uniref:uncharacterized protein LOC108607238 n=1 Tax=Drosophila busckii TaxID=30019 RepID=UPI00083EE721|nr:uncharacterized protein LOC108607238 [Drosophila busckii]
MDVITKAQEPAPEEAIADVKATLTYNIIPTNSIAIAEETTQDAESNYFDDLKIYYTSLSALHIDSSLSDTSLELFYKSSITSHAESAEIEVDLWRLPLEERQWPKASRTMQYKEFIDRLIAELCGNRCTRRSLIVQCIEMRFQQFLLTVLSSFFWQQSLIQLPVTITRRGLLKAVNWLTQPIKQITPKELVELFAVAVLCEIDELKVQCWQCFAEMIKKRNCGAAIYMYSRRMGVAVERCLIYMVGVTLMPFVASREFRRLDFNLIKRLLASSTLTVNTEIEVFYAVIYWLDGDWTKRQHVAHFLMKQVHLEKLPLVFLISIPFRKDGPEALYYFSQSKRMFNRCLSSVQAGMQREYKRGWIYDPNCSYHCSEAAHSRQQFVTYREFINYLKYLQTQGKNYGKLIDGQRQTDD